MSTIDIMHPTWRDQIVGHSLRAGELNFTDVAALLEDMASGGYPYRLDEDRVAVRIAIVARAAELLRMAPELLAQVDRYARGCGECDGKGYVYEGEAIIGQGPDDVFPEQVACSECADIRAALAKVRP